MSKDIAKTIAESVYDVLRQHDNESIQEADWRQLANEAGAVATAKLAASAALAHDFVKTGDADSFRQIEDRNREVVLDYCRRCHQAEGQLTPTCPGEPKPTTTEVTP